jgi:hypothetical protein
MSASENSIITLSRPVKIDGVDVSELHFRRMSQGDKRRAIKQTEGVADELSRLSDMNMFLATSLCLEGLTPEIYESLDGEDGNAIDTMMQSFLVPSSAAKK